MLVCLTWLCNVEQSERLASDIAARMPAAGVAALCAALAAATPAMAVDLPQLQQAPAEVQQKAESALKGLDFPGSETKTQVHLTPSQVSFSRLRHGFLPTCSRIRP